MVGTKRTSHSSRRRAPIECFGGINTPEEKALFNKLASTGGVTGRGGKVTVHHKEIAKAFNAMIDDSLANPNKLSQSVGLKYKTELHVKVYVDKLKRDMSTRDALFCNTQAQPTREPTTQAPPLAPSLVPRPPVPPGAAHTPNLLPVSSHAVHPYSALPGQPFVNLQQTMPMHNAMAYPFLPWGMQPASAAAGKVCRKCTAAHGYQVYFKDPRCNCMSEAVKAGKAAKRQRPDSN